MIIAKVGLSSQYSSFPYIVTEFTKHGLPIIRGQIVRVCDRYPDEGILLIQCVCGGRHFHGWELKNDHHIVEPRTAHCAGLNGIWYHVSVFEPDDWRYRSHVVRPGKRWKADARRKGLRA